MRRLKILYYWFFTNKNNITFIELLKFLVKPKIESIASNFISSIHANAKEVEIKFKNSNYSLFWPSNFSFYRFNQIVCESFDPNDWHYYQKTHTEVEKGEIILDIGTAEGLLPLLVIDKCDHIYMVEPSRIFCECLKKTFTNHLDKITIFNVAIGNEDGNILFDENSIDGKVTQENNNNAYTIDIYKIDSLLKNKEKITYLKADIEGFEQEMLKGAEQTIKRNKPKIAITTYHEENNPDDIIKLILSYVPEYNYYIKGIYEIGPKPVMIHFWIE